MSKTSKWKIVDIINTCPERYLTWSRLVSLKTESVNNDDKVAFFKWDFQNSSSISVTQKYVINLSKGIQKWCLALSLWHRFSYFVKNDTWKLSELFRKLTCMFCLISLQFCFTTYVFRVILLIYSNKQLWIVSSLMKDFVLLLVEH